jgi:flagellar basal-body rod protein FlgB
MSDVRLGGDEASKTIRRILDLNAARQKAAVKNLANIDTEGYRPKRVEFADHLNQATGRVEMSRTAPGHLAGAASGPGQPRYVEVVDREAAESPETELERSVADLADAEIAYSTAARLMSKRVATIRTAITGKP